MGKVIFCTEPNRSRLVVIHRVAQAKVMISFKDFIRKPLLISLENVY